MLTYDTPASSNIRLFSDNKKEQQNEKPIGHNIESLQTSKHAQISKMNTANTENTNKETFEHFQISKMNITNAQNINKQTSEHVQISKMNITNVRLCNYYRTGFVMDHRAARTYLVSIPLSILFIIFVVFAALSVNDKLNTEMDQKLSNIHYQIDLQFQNSYYPLRIYYQ
eukprot:73339_1